VITFTNDGLKTFLFQHPQKFLLFLLAAFFDPPSNQALLPGVLTPELASLDFPALQHLVLNHSVI